MRDDTRRTPEPCMCGDPACQWCGNGGERDKLIAAAQEWCDMAPIRWQGTFPANRAHERHVAAAAQYGDEWRRRDNLAECIDEIADAMNYVLYAHSTGHIRTEDTDWFMDRLSLFACKLLHLRDATAELIPDIEQAHASALAEKEDRDGDHS